ncbi:transposase [Actinocrinis puniceicyclus]|uniref:Transposase n=1 Tax=Actinocrinis puniceicyclus TaxID=977794 RepID=A0A8J8BGH6_9ACTN|nr:transposase family protein [Actinocrinis puniceicyclus]MBS2967146.1 transposase [Actinocrinis puniceicyclus]
MRLDALTGLTHGQRAELRRRIVEHLGTALIARPGGRPSALCLEGSIDLVCVLLRTNLTQDQAAALFEVSQATASRRWDLLRDTIALALAALVPTVREIVGRGGSVLVDGFLAPTWDWKHARGMYSDKHQESGFNIQVAASIAGDLAAVGDPIPGARHDAYAYAASGLAARLAGHDTLGDKGYQGHATIHPIRKPPKAELTAHDQRFNASVSSIRAAVERTNSHLQNWKILTTRFRPPLEKFPATLRAIVGLYYLKWAFE